MPKRRKKSEDVNQTAHRVVVKATGEIEKPRPARKKNAAAVALGKLGGAKGGTARARSLTPERRKEIAEQAAAARWGKPS